MRTDSFIIKNKLGWRLPLNFNFVRCDVIPQEIERFSMAYYDKRYKRLRDPQYSNEFLRILE